ncbi:MAG: hypothetical protein ACKO96_12560, partial [Flammeovirgaceae bacterium]
PPQTGQTTLDASTQHLTQTQEPSYMLPIDDIANEVNREPTRGHLSDHAHCKKQSRNNSFSFGDCIKI